MESPLNWASHDPTTGNEGLDPPGKESFMCSRGRASQSALERGEQREGGGLALRPPSLQMMIRKLIISF